MKFTKAAAWIAVLSLCAGVAATPVLAADEDALTKDSEATVTFGIDPDEQNPLRLVEVPGFNFGSRTISIADQSYPAVGETEGVEPDLGIQVVDVRGSGAGWQVTAEMEKALSAGENDLLRGARIRFGRGDVSYVGGTLNVDRIAPVHEGNQSEVVLNNATGTPVAIFTAEQHSGQGQWRDQLMDVYLDVPGGVAKATLYSGTILWTLGDVPTDE